MFGETYGYQSSISKLMTNHLKKIYQKLVLKKYIDNKSSIIDIGSNDGTFLNFFFFLKKVISFMELIQLQVNLKNFINHTSKE